MLSSYNNMKIFLSWSGERSQKVAALLNEWLRCVVQAAQPWFSPDDIDMGSIWFTEINQQLATMNNGIVCLTRSNMTKPWILFEAGALAKGLDSSRVFVFLIDMKSKEVKDPLGQFNHTLPEKESLRKLVKNINSGLGENQIAEFYLSKIFETYWPQFDKSFKEILKSTPDEEVPEVISQDEILGDVVSTLRSIERRLRGLEERPQQHHEDINLGATLPISSVQSLDLRMRIRKLMQEGKTDSDILALLGPGNSFGVVSRLMGDERRRFLR